MSKSEKKRKKILVVEDEPILGRIFKRILGVEGFEVDVLNNGLSAQEAASNNEYDLCISDIRLPGVSGIQLYQYLEMNNEALSQKLIFITGDTMNSEIQAFLNTAGRPCLLKPFNPDELVTAVHNIIQ